LNNVVECTGIYCALQAALITVQFSYVDMIYSTKKNQAAKNQGLLQVDPEFNQV
jgi:hypothetical protein